MKKNSEKPSRMSGAAKTSRILRYYENQSDDEAAAEIETARAMELADLLWAVLMLPEFQIVR